MYRPRRVGGRLFGGRLQADAGLEAERQKPGERQREPFAGVALRFVQERLGRLLDQAEQPGDAPASGAAVYGVLLGPHDLESAEDRGDVRLAQCVEGEGPRRGVDDLLTLKRDETDGDPGLGNARVRGGRLVGKAVAGDVQHDGVPARGLEAFPAWSAVGADPGEVSAACRQDLANAMAVGGRDVVRARVVRPQAERREGVEGFCVHDRAAPGDEGGARRSNRPGAAGCQSVVATGARRVVPNQLVSYRKSPKGPVSCTPHRTRLAARRWSGSAASKVVTS